MDENMFDLGLDVATISAELPDPVITLSGADSYTVQDTADYPLLALNVYGKSVQDGTPTPDAPIDIVNVGDDGAVEVAACGKNLLQINPEYSITDKGITVTSKLDDNGLWCVEVKGTSTSNYIDFRPFGGSAVTKALNLPDGDYILSGIQPNSGLRLVALCRNDQNPKIDIGNGVKLTQGDNDYYYIRLDVLSEGDFNTVIYPMLRPTSITDSTYEPYKGTTVTITSGLPLCSVGDVRDELVYNVDGTGKIIKRTAKIVFDGSNDEAWQHSEGNAPFQITISDGSLWESRLDLPRLYCNKYQRVPQGATWGSYDYMVSTNTNGTLLAIRDTSITTLEEFKAKLNAVPMVVVYVLATPKEIELSSAEMAELQKLQSYEGTTSIYNDEQAEMLVKMLRSDYDMKYIEWLKESQTWACPKAGKWKVICVGGGASGGIYEKATSSGATEQTLIATVAGGTTSFGSIVAADGAPSTNDYTTHGYSGEIVGVSGYGGYTGVDYGGAPSIGNSTTHQEFGAAVGNKNAGMYAIANPAAALGYGAGGGAVGRLKANYDVSPIPGRAGSIESTIVDLDEGQTIMCTVGKGGQTTDATAMGNGADGVIVVQYLGY